MASGSKGGICVAFMGQMYPSLVRRFEVLSGKDFSSRVFSFSAYKAVCEMIEEERIAGEKLLPFLKNIIKKTVGGKVTALKLTKEAGGIVKIDGCAEAKLHGPSDAGVCYLSAGIIEAAVEKYAQKQVRVTERKCLSKGDSLCEFAVMVGSVDFAQEGVQEAPQGLSDLVHQ